MKLRSTPVSRIAGEARVPGDKSISHRALILGAMAEGDTQISGLLEGDDVLATAAAVRALGARVERTGPGSWGVTGAPWRSPGSALDCGNSGTACRLLLGAAAGWPVTAGFTGDVSLSNRPMRRVTAPLVQMGARFEGGDRLPLTLHGGDLSGIEHVSDVASAQVKSAILLAGLRAEGITTVTEPERSRDHSERMLRAFGVRVEETDVGTGRRISIHPGHLLGRPVAVPADPSSAAFPLVAALIAGGGRVTLPGILLNPLRTGLFTTLAEMGATVETLGESLGVEPVGTLIASPSSLKGVETAPERAPSMIDEYPILCIAAAFARGTTVMRGLAELRVKESDRIALMVTGLRACGVRVEDGPDWIAVHGTGGEVLGGAEIETHGDHRIAMSFLVLGTAARSAVAVRDAEMIATSFPGFVPLMTGLGADIRETA